MMTNIHDAHVDSWVRHHARRLSRKAKADGFKPQALHEYTDLSGNPTHWRIRLKHQDTGDKWIRPLMREGADFALKQPDYPNGTPLYRLHDLAARQAEPVLIVEGETCSDSLAELGILASTSGGADSAGRADWSILAGRVATIWPDNDEAGKRYAQAVKTALESIDCAVAVINVAALDLPAKGDCADWLAIHSGATAADVLALPKIAPPESTESDDQGVADTQTPPETGEPLAASEEKFSLFDDEGKKKSQSILLVDLCADIELFHDDGGETYAVIKKPSHREVWPIQSRSFKNWLSQKYFASTGQGARGAAVLDALATVEARAQHQAEQRQVFQRVAWLDDRIVIDLADETWRVIEIDSAGWRVLDRAPVMFTRRSGMAPLPVPVQGSLADIEQFINVEPDSLPLVIGWLLMAARGRGPYPVQVLNGEQGTGKSTTTRVLRSVIDPSTVPLRGMTRDVRDLLVTATNNHVIVADNLSGLSAELSDVFCRFSTGGGFAERKLYSNREEVLVNIQRPIILNGIDEVASRGDLMERSLIIHQPIIKEAAREPESAFWKRFESALPGIIGGLCDALSCAIKNQYTVKLERKPRMADFALWVTAAESALGWKPGTFMDSYTANLDAGVEVALEASPFGEALLKYMTKSVTWTGTATDLLNELERIAHERATRSPSWPKSGKGAASALRRMAPLFRRMGITIDQQHREAGTGRRIVMIDSAGFSPSQSSHRHKPNNGAVSSRDDYKIEPSHQSSHRHSIVTPKPSIGAACDEGDCCDAKKQELTIPSAGVEF